MNNTLESLKMLDALINGAKIYQHLDLGEQLLAQFLNPPIFSHVSLDLVLLVILIVEQGVQVEMVADVEPEQDCVDLDERELFRQGEDRTLGFGEIVQKLDTFLCLISLHLGFNEAVNHIIF